MNSIDYRSIILTNGIELFGRIENLSDNICRIHNPLVVLKKILHSTNEEGKVLERFNASSKYRYVDISLSNILSISELSDLMCEYCERSLEYCESYLDIITDSNIRNILKLLEKINKEKVITEEEVKPRVILVSEIAEGNETKH